MPVTESEVSFQSLSTQPQDEPLHVDLRDWKRSTQCGLGISLDNSVLMLPVQQDTSSPHRSCDGIWLFQHLTWFLWMQNSAKTLRWSVVMYGFAARAYSSRASEICREIIIGRCMLLPVADFDQGWPSKMLATSLNGMAISAQIALTLGSRRIHCWWLQLCATALLNWQGLFQYDPIRFGYLSYRHIVLLSVHLLSVVVGFWRAGPDNQVSLNGQQALAFFCLFSVGLIKGFWLLRNH